MRSPFRWYVGLKQGMQPVGVKLHPRQVEQQRPVFRALIGPFETKRAAVWFSKNPTTPLQTVAEIEEEAKHA